MIAALVSPSSASVANGVQVRETVVLTIAAVLFVALLIVVLVSIWLAVRRPSDRRLADSRELETIEMIQTPADAWACMGTLESMLPVARVVDESADVGEAVAECDVAMPRANERADVIVAQWQHEPGHWSREGVEERDITSANANDVEVNNEARPSWVEDDAVAALWASLRRDESAEDASDKSKGIFQALAAHW